MIYSSEMDRGFDILELEPSEQLSKNEIEAAKLVRFTQYNPQSQPRIEWPAAFPAVRSYLDQLVRGKGRRDALNALARQVDRDVAGAKDADRVRAMSAAIKALAKATT